MDYELIITADTNDADYITSIEIITEDMLNQLRPLFKAIKENGRRHNWPANDRENTTPNEIYPECHKIMITEKGEDLTCSIVDYLDDIVPYGEYGVHTIESITASPAVNKEKLV